MPSESGVGGMYQPVESAEEGEGDGPGRVGMIMWEGLGRDWGGGEVLEMELVRRPRVVAERVGPTLGGRLRERDRESVCSLPY